MNRFKLMTCALGLSALACTVQSCTDDDNDNITLLRPTALVTVRPTGDGTFTLQLDNTTTLSPSNMKSSPFGDKEVRALVNYTETDTDSSGSTRSVHVNWMDSIRTNAPVPDLGTKDGQDVKLKLSWKSFSGKKSAEFDLRLHAPKLTDYAASMEHTRSVE